MSFNKEMLINELKLGRVVTLDNIDDFQHILKMNISPCIWEKAVQNNQLILQPILLAKELKIDDSSQVIYFYLISLFTNLTLLEVIFNEIADISMISGLKNLVELCLQDNSISDISAIQNLSGLEILDVSYNKITSYTLNSRVRHTVWEWT
ncbi:Conserved_hypothetical protein [Hexamita inflata]|uniref:Uncharacterized protein n=1 Tax=Hexamita inflata TaxID=28002 RepID=A0AA86QXM4_9EUKA|nr:Conserved hypothetical protein [Hexamita inflata]